MQKSKIAVWGGLKIAVKKREVPGSSPGGSREFEAGTELESGKGLFNYKYKRD